MSFGNSYIVQHYSGHIEDTRDTLRDKPLTMAHFVGASITPPVSNNVVQGSGRLKLFACDAVLTERSSVSAMQIDFYDTSGSPTGSEPKIFGMIAFAQKVGGVNEGFTQHNIVFPEAGVRFENGIGSICTPLFGNPTIVSVDANFGYVATNDDYP